MFTVTYYFYFRIPTHSTVFAFAALLWGRAARASVNNHRRVGPRVHPLAHHRRAEPDYKVDWLPVQLVLYPRFTGWQPVPGLWRCFADLINIV